MPEADRIMRLAFGTFLGLPDPMAFMGDRNFMAPRFRAKHVKVLGARLDARLIGVVAATRWGAFGFFGPLVVLPEFWDKGVAQRLLEPTTKLFDRWGVRYSGLFTFAHSAKHVGLYQKFGYWPTYLTALMTYTPDAAPQTALPTVLSNLPRQQREQAIVACAQLTNRIDKGLDLTEEIRTVLTQRTGDVVLIFTRATLEGFAICVHGAGSEAGTRTCYVKFGAARNDNSFDRLLAACEAFAGSHGVNLEAGVNFARENAYRRMKARGYRTMTQGVAMLRPHVAGFNRTNAYVIDDWR
ncbi:MAG TPA: GNAT family N-acetyltransferase [Acidobacteriaceae bacterium]|nr:GNAT family N-acetyltransferase [Acidobacteriaceae bacterium]